MPIVRIKPYNPRKGYALRTFTVFGQTFRVDDGWYEVDATTAAYLRKVRNSDDEDKPLAFDVVQTEEEAVALEEAEAARAAQRVSPQAVAKRANIRNRSTPAEPDHSVMTTRDLPKADLPGDESDLDSDDLSAVVEREARPRARRLVNPDDEGTAVEGDPVDSDPGSADDGAEDPPPAPAAPPVTRPATPGGTSGRRTPGSPRRGG